jgi:hypothetical protein
VKLPAPDLGTEAQPGPKSDVVDAPAAAAEADEDGIGDDAAADAEDEGVEAAGVLELLLHAAAPTASPAAATEAARMRYCMMVTPCIDACYSSWIT